MACWIILMLIHVALTTINVSSKPLRKNNKGISVKQFWSQVRCLIGFEDVELVDKYGCFCRKFNQPLSSNPEPLDTLDRCCQKRQQCYNDVNCPMKNHNYMIDKGCDAGDQFLLCDNNIPQSCPHEACNCDKEAAHCIKNAIDNNDYNLEYYNVAGDLLAETCKTPSQSEHQSVENMLSNSGNEVESSVGNPDDNDDGPSLEQSVDSPDGSSVNQIGQGGSSEPIGDSETSDGRVKEISQSSGDLPEESIGQSIDSEKAEGLVPPEVSGQESQSGEDKLKQDDSADEIDIANLIHSAEESVSNEGDGQLGEAKNGQHEQSDKIAEVPTDSSEQIDEASEVGGGASEQNLSHSKDETQTQKQADQSEQTSDTSKEETMKENVVQDATSDKDESGQQNLQSSEVQQIKSEENQEANQKSIDDDSTQQNGTGNEKSDGQTEKENVNGSNEGQNEPKAQKPEEEPINKPLGSDVSTTTQTEVCKDINHNALDLVTIEGVEGKDLKDDLLNSHHDLHQESSAFTIKMTNGLLFSLKELVLEARGVDEIHVTLMQRSGPQMLTITANNHDKLETLSLDIPENGFKDIDFIGLMFYVTDATEAPFVRLVFFSICYNPEVCSDTDGDDKLRNFTRVLRNDGVDVGHSVFNKELDIGVEDAIKLCLGSGPVIFFTLKGLALKVTGIDKLKIYIMNDQGVHSVQELKPSATANWELVSFNPDPPIHGVKFVGIMFYPVTSLNSSGSKIKGLFLNMCFHTGQLGF